VAKAIFMMIPRREGIRVVQALAADTVSPGLRARSITAGR
jgi:hypothetical protein